MGCSEAKILPGLLLLISAIFVVLLSLLIFGV